MKNARFTESGIPALNRRLMSVLNSRNVSRETTREVSRSGNVVRTGQAVSAEIGLELDLRGTNLSRYVTHDASATAASASIRESSNPSASIEGPGSGMRTMYSPQGPP